MQVQQKDSLIRNKVIHYHKLVEVYQRYYFFMTGGGPVIIRKNHMEGSCHGSLTISLESMQT